jgi:hypothetical protein
MRPLPTAALLALFHVTAMLPASAIAAGPAPATFGVSWDGSGSSLQQIVDDYLGIPGAVNVLTDYVGGHAGDLDPWYWHGKSVPALLIREIAGNANTNELGWYIENGAAPALAGDGVRDGIVFAGLQGAAASTVVIFPSDMTRFGFYLDTHTQVLTPLGVMGQVFYTNRHFNDAGLNGFGATRVPAGGDVQALVFDVSRWKGPNAWLVCFEDMDAGAPITACCSGTDDDYNDFVFLVTALGASPNSMLTFGALKARYR